MNNFETIIGIEIHIELNTKTKMFSSAPIDFHAEPNTCASEVDLGYPGTLPTVNKQAVVSGIKLAKALNMEIDDLLRFDRKNYFYADLPKGFQITQDKYPIGKNGFLIVNSKKIDIERIHLEEDTAKSIHKNGLTFLNYNRAGIPLIEVVTKPVIGDSLTAISYVKLIRDIALMLDISDAKMEEGSLRADINISLRPYGQKEFGTKVEIKNLNSLSNIEEAITYEINLQKKQYLSGEEVLQATKRFDEETKTTKLMRVKTSAIDYKYFPEPNIPPIRLSQEFINLVKPAELPWELKQRLESYDLDNEYIEKFLNNFSLVKSFDQINFEDKKIAAKIFFAEIVALANNQSKRVDELKIDWEQFSLALSYLQQGKISGKHIKEIVPLLSETNATVDEIILERSMKQISDENYLTNIIKNIVNESQNFISENQDREERITKFILGKLMKETNGQANPIVSANLVSKIWRIGVEKK